MKSTISIKDLRQNLAEVADQVEQGKSFVVIRRSKPSFRVTPVGAEEGLETEWETVMDFTAGGKKKGVKIESVLELLKKINAAQR